MALMMGTLHDARRDAGAGDESARLAAEDAAAYDHRPAKIDGELALLKRMAGFNIAMTAAVPAKLLV